jgi:hypothetical protein
MSTEKSKTQEALPSPIPADETTNRLAPDEIGPIELEKISGGRSGGDPST